MIEREVGIPTGFYRRLEFETGEEPYINVGVSTKIIPYYAKLKYLLDLEDQSSPYYLFSMGVNLVEGEDIAFDAFLDDLSQRVNYGIGVGITFKDVEVEILYGKYNYQNIGIPHQDEKSLYSSTKITFGCKYRF
ncbi:porin family protein [Fusobacteria bacterium ZRK30]|nr:porin family protein [Fusobacteria bacterium ZRK30]